MCRVRPQEVLPRQKSRERQTRCRSFGAGTFAVRRRPRTIAAIDARRVSSACSRTRICACGTGLAIRAALEVAVRVLGRFAKIALDERPVLRAIRRGVDPRSVLQRRERTYPQCARKLSCQTHRKDSAMNVSPLMLGLAALVVVVVFGPKRLPSFKRSKTANQIDLTAMMPSQP